MARASYKKPRLEAPIIYVFTCRNPYDRLLSAYKDKVLGEDNYTYIMKEPCEWLTYNSPMLTFKQFVTCVVDRVRATALRNRLDNLSGYIASHTLDIHWRPIFHSALPCHVNYTLISDFKNFDDDSQRVLALLHINSSVPHTNPSSKIGRTDWYTEIDASLITALQQIYFWDFIIFGYKSTPPGMVGVVATTDNVYR